MTEDPLITAVRAGDDDAVRLLLEDGADPEAVDAHGTSALCLAVAAFDSNAAGYLVEAGADALRRLPDGSTPLLRAVDSGSVGLVLEVLGGDDESPPDGPARAELLARARRWHERGPVAVLRERSGCAGPVERTTVRDREWTTWYHELRLGGLTVRDGHTGVLTLLETRFGLCPGVGELAGRAGALEVTDAEHASWSELVRTLAARQDDPTWQDAAALRAHPGPVHRRFGAEVLAALHLGGYRHGARSPFAARSLALFLDWAGEERHPQVLAAVLAGLGHHEDPRIEPLALAHTAHRAPQVRRAASGLLERIAPQRPGHWTYTPAGLAAMLRLARDPDASVRRSVACRLAESRDPAPGIGDALAELVDDEEQTTRIYAVFGLAERDDPRCVAAAGRVGPVADRAAWSWILDAPDRYRRRTAAG
ncbi:ankyrin repeat domain-containing protein [Kitasatospora sp. NPDC093550]|uniref:ankyrin repeat domain-containing protein n=1 Tax=Kitasatospora sp. NPDC093550 TaxID=3364089 RepID=UPI00382ED21C